MKYFFYYFWTLKKALSIVTLFKQTNVHIWCLLNLATWIFQVIVLCCWVQFKDCKSVTCGLKNDVGSFTTTKYTLAETFLPSWNTVLFSCSSVGLFLTCKPSFWFPVVGFSQLLPRESPTFQGQSSFYRAEFKKTLSSFVLVCASHTPNAGQTNLCCDEYHSDVHTVTKGHLIKNLHK